MDPTPPEAEIKTAKLAHPSDPRTLVLEWKAQDKNIETLPIIFEYAEMDAAGKVGEWHELTQMLPNSGRYVCATPQLSAGSYRFKIRINVYDKAGNVTPKEFAEPISLDVTRPQIEIIDVKTPPKSSPPKEP